LIGLVDNVDDVDDILSVSRLIYSYAEFKSAIDLGFTVGLNDVPFEKAMFFSWIKEVANDRKT
jgi:hypothetical protein